MEPFGKIWSIKRFEICDSEDGPQTLSKVFTLYLSILLLLGLVLSIEVPIGLKILTPPEFWVGSLIVVLAVSSRILLACYYHFFFGLLHSKKTQFISLVQFLTTVINVGASLVLIKPFGILGAVLVSGLTSLAQCVMGYFFGQKYYYIPFEWANIIKVASMACLLFLLINQISVDVLGVGPWLNQNFTPLLGDLLGFFHLNSIKNGKLVTYILSNVPLVVEGGIKFIFSLLFVPGLVMLGIIPRGFVLKVFSFQTLKNPARIFSEA